MKWLGGSFAVSVLFLLSSFVLIAAPNPIPEPEIVHSSADSVDQVIKKMYVSHEFDSTFSGVESGVDLLKLEKDAMREFINSSVPAVQKILINKRYGVGDLEVAELEVEAVKKGFNEVLHFTDANTFISATFNEGEKSHSRFKSDELNDSESGNVMRTLLKGGLKWNDPQYGIYSQPLFNRDILNIIPIMHEKLLALVTYGDKDAIIKARTFFGTANQTINERYNRIFELSESELYAAEYMMAETRRMQEAFAEGLSIDKIKSLPPRQIQYKDSTFMEVAFTDGKYNPNLRMVKIFDEAAGSNGKIMVKKVVFSHFVFTNSEVFRALKEVMTAQPEMTVQGVLDDKFISTDGWGLSAAFAGYLVDRPMGHHVWAFPSDLRSRMFLNAYQRMRVDEKGEFKKEQDPDGAPIDRHVWHDKTTMIYVEENGVDWVYVLTGSFNNSNHYQNAEMQVMFKFRGNSPWVKSIHDSIIEVSAKEKEFSIPLNEAVFRNALARFLGQSLFDISIIEAKTLMQNLELGNFLAAKRTLEKIGSFNSTLRPDLRISQGELKDRIRKIMAFIRFYKDQPDFEKISAQKLVAIALMLVERNRNKIPNEEEKAKFWRSVEIRQLLDFVLWYPNITPVRQSEAVEKAWKVLEIDLPVPPSWEEVAKENVKEPVKTEASDPVSATPSVRTCLDDLKDVGQHS